MGTFVLKLYLVSPNYYYYYYYYYLYLITDRKKLAAGPKNDFKGVNILHPRTVGAEKHITFH
jgi:hypothetical protein